MSRKWGIFLFRAKVKPAETVLIHGASGAVRFFLLFPYLPYGNYLFIYFFSFFLPFSNKEMCF